MIAVVGGWELWSMCGIVVRAGLVCGKKLIVLLVLGAYFFSCVVFVWACV